MNRILKNKETTADTKRLMMQKLKKVFKKYRANQLANKLILSSEKISSRLKR